MYLLNRAEFLERLVDNVIQVNFTKKDGTLRSMICTLKDGIVPENNETDRLVSKPKNEVMNVWDVEKNDWRSFRLDSVRSVLCPAPDYV